MYRGALNKVAVGERDEKLPDEAGLAGVGVERKSVLQTNPEQSERVHEQAATSDGSHSLFEEAAKLL